MHDPVGDRRGPRPPRRPAADHRPRSALAHAAHRLPGAPARRDAPARPRRQRAAGRLGAGAGPAGERGGDPRVHGSRTARAHVCRQRPRLATRQRARGRRSCPKPSRWPSRAARCGSTSCAARRRPAAHLGGAAHGRTRRRRKHPRDRGSPGSCRDGAVRELPGRRRRRLRRDVRRRRRSAAPYRAAARRRSHEVTRARGRGPGRGAADALPRPGRHLRHRRRGAGVPARHPAAGHRAGHLVDDRPRASSSGSGRSSCSSPTSTTPGRSSTTA